MPVTASSCMHSYVKRKQYLLMGKLHLTILTDHANIRPYMWEVQDFCKQLYLY